MCLIIHYAKSWDASKNDTMGKPRPDLSRPLSGADITHLHFFPWLGEKNILATPPKLSRQNKRELHALDISCLLQRSSVCAGLQPVVIDSLIVLAASQDATLAQFWTPFAPCVRRWKRQDSNRNAEINDMLRIEGRGYYA